MIKLSTHAQSILDRLNDRYASQTCKKFYGTSPYRNWQIQLSRIISSLEHTPNKFGMGLRFSTDWGQIDYSRIRGENIIKVIINDFHFNYKDLHKWFTSAIYPPTTKKISRKPLKVHAISFVKPYRCMKLPNGQQIYAIQSDTHLYSLADSGKQQVINYWFSSLTFPLNEKIGDLNIIGYGDINSIPYYIDDGLQLHHGAEIAILQRNKNFESINRKQVLRLTETEFKQMLVEYITKIINEIA